MKTNVKHEFLAWKFGILQSHFTAILTKPRISQANLKLKGKSTSTPNLVPYGKSEAKNTNKNSLLVEMAPKRGGSLA